MDQQTFQQIVSRISETVGTNYIDDQAWQELAAEILPPGYSLVVTINLELGPVFGYDSAYGAVYGRNGAIARLSSDSIFGNWGGPLPIGYAYDVHILKGGAEDYAGWAAQIEFAGGYGGGLTIPLFSVPEYALAAYSAARDGSFPYGGGRLAARSGYSSCWGSVRGTCP